MNNVRSAKKIKGETDSNNIVGYYQSGWSVVEIAVEAECKVKDVLRTLQENNVTIKAEHLQEAESHLEMENELDFHMLSKAK